MDSLPIELVLLICKDYSVFNTLARALPFLGNRTLTHDYRMLFKTYDDGTKLCGRLHSFDGSPAIECTNGSKYWYVNGNHHRANDLPAIEYVNGDKEWYVNGKRHRANDLPAIEYANGSKYWYVNGINYIP